MRSLDEVFEDVKQDQANERMQTEFFVVLRALAVKIARTRWTPKEQARNEEGIIEAVENVFMNWPREYPAQEGGCFSKWAYQSIKNDLANWLAKEHTRREVSLSNPAGESDDGEEGLAFDPPAPQDLDMETKLDYKRAIASLPPTDRVFFRLRAAGYTFPEISTKCGIPMKTLHDEWFRIEARLKSSLSQ